MDGVGPDDEKPGSSSQLSPLGHCGPVPSSQPAPNTKQACPGKTSPTTSSVVASTSNADVCAQGAPPSGPVASYGGQATGPALTTGAASIPLSSAQSASSSSFLSKPWVNVSSEYGGFGTGTAPGTNPFSSSMSSGTGVFSAGPLSANATGTSDKSWASGTAAPGSWNSSRETSSPSGPTTTPIGSVPGSWNASTGGISSGFTAAPTGSLPDSRKSSNTLSSSSGPLLSSFPAVPAESASQGPLEGAPRDDNSTSSTSQGPTGSSVSPLAPSSPAAAGETSSIEEVTESSSSLVAAAPSAPYDPPGQVLQGRTSTFMQQGEVEDLTNSFAFPESPTGLYRRMWQPADLHGVGGPASSAMTTSSTSPHNSSFHWS